MKLDFYFYDRISHCAYPLSHYPAPDQNLRENCASKRHLLDLPWWYGLKNIFFSNKTFWFFKIESWNFQYPFEIKFCETSENFNLFSWFRQLLFPFFSLGCLIDLKLCEVSWNSYSNWFWKFQLSIFKNEKSFIHKKNIF